MLCQPSLQKAYRTMASRTFLATLILLDMWSLFFLLLLPGSCSLGRVRCMDLSRPWSLCFYTFLIQTSLHILNWWRLICIVWVLFCLVHGAYGNSPIIEVWSTVWFLRLRWLWARSLNILLWLYTLWLFVHFCSTICQYWSMPARKEQCVFLETTFWSMQPIFVSRFWLWYLSLMLVICLTGPLLQLAHMILAPEYLGRYSLER